MLLIFESNTLQCREIQHEKNVMDNTNERDSYNAKPPVFDGEKTDYWKDKI